MNVWKALLATGILAACLGTPAAQATPAAETWQQPVMASFGHTDPAEVSVPMRDGVVLKGDVLYPTDPVTHARANGTFPVLLLQNPYFCDTTESNIGFLSNPAVQPAYYVDRGYIFVVMCVRGTGRSGGEFDLFGPAQQQDGVELAQWTERRLAGSNGTVGLVGCSYPGASALFTAGALPRNTGVKAIASMCVGSEFHREAGFSGGMATPLAINYFTSLGQLMGPRAGAWGLRAANDLLVNGVHAFDDAWTQTRTIGTYAKQIAGTDIPVLLWSGYADAYPAGAQELYAALQNAHFHRSQYAPMTPGQQTTPRYQIVNGPGGHGEGIDPVITLAWLDTWLKGRPTGMATTDTPMHLYQQGSGKWINTATVPMLRESTSYYLGKGGTLSESRPWTWDRDSITYGPNGSLTYTTKPLEQGGTLAGPISASLVASSTGTNLQLIGTLSDVDPQGTVTRISSGSLVGDQRALDRKRSWYDQNGNDIRPYGTFTGVQPLQPGRDYMLEFPMSARVAEIKPGHALRLTITTQPDPAACKVLIGADPCFPTAAQQRTLPGTYQVRLGVSKINVPLARYGCFPASGGTGATPSSFRGPVRACR